MEYFKKFGSIGFAIAFVGFIMVFIQNTLDSKLIQDSINYNLIYSKNLQVEDGGLAYYVIHLKNNGIKSIDSVRIKMKSHTNKVIGYDVLDTADFKISIADTLKLMKQIIVHQKSKLYPKDHTSLLVTIRTQGEISSLSEIEVSVNNALTNGIEVENALVDEKVNYANIKLYIQAATALLSSIFFSIVGPIFIIALLLIISFTLFKKTKLYKLISKYFLDDYK